MYNPLSVQYGVQQHTHSKNLQHALMTNNIYMLLAEQFAVDGKIGTHPHLNSMTSCVHLDLLACLNAHDNCKGS